MDSSVGMGLGVGSGIGVGVGIAVGVGTGVDVRVGLAAARVEVGVDAGGDEGMTVEVASARAQPPNSRRAKVKSRGHRMAVTIVL